jgi:hypothetical protein
MMLQDLTIRIVDNWPCGDLCAGLWDLVPYFHSSGSYGSITTRHFIDHIGLCYSHKICYIIIWHVSTKSLYIYTFRDTGIMEMDPATGSIYFGDPGVDRHLIIPNTHTILPSVEVRLKMTIE